MAPREFTCNSCGKDYGVTRENGQAFLFIGDPRCNHVLAECPHCGVAERIFCPPDLFVAVVDCGKVKVDHYPEASQVLRVRAEQVWLAAYEAAEAGEAGEDCDDDECDGSCCSAEPVAAVEADPVEADPDASVPTRDLTAEDQEVVEHFADTLAAIPTDLLWDGFRPADDGS